MNIVISGHQVEVTKALDDRIRKKLLKISRHSDEVFKVEVVLHVEKIRHKAEATLYGKNLKAHASAEKADNMYAVIDDLVDKLDRQVIRHKEKASNA